MNVDMSELGFLSGRDKSVLQSTVRNHGVTINGYTQKIINYNHKNYKTGYAVLTLIDAKKLLDVLENNPRTFVRECKPVLIRFLKNKLKLN